jgi:aldehyde dehydrogenase (NAD+)
MCPVAAAVAAGNTVILKPCNVSSACSRLQAELLAEYVDPAVVSCVGPGIKGDRHTTAALLEERFDHIFFTGSPDVGKVIAAGAAKHLTPCTLELGGKNPVFVDKSADVSLAAKRTLWGRNMNAGQQCVSPDFVLCHEDVVDEFCESAKGWLKTFFKNEVRARVARSRGGLAANSFFFYAPPGPQEVRELRPHRRRRPGEAHPGHAQGPRRRGHRRRQGRPQDPLHLPHGRQD